ncbi:NosR/NirI family protein [Paracoccus sp. EGI L200073]|nr:NosR/NirI family protein [Paracoccus salsus]MCF3973534.1 NosR/NirI family protein [Paracoccus salsus]
MRPGSERAIETAKPTRAIAAGLFGRTGPMALQRQDDAVPGWKVLGPSEPLGFIASTWEVTRSVGYSGRPLEMLVAVDMQARITGARLMRHSEPILTLGLSDEDIARFVDGFAGIDLTDPDGAGQGPDMPDIISRATVSTGVIRDSILRTARTLAIARGLLPGGGIDRVSYAPRDWDALIEQGAITRRTVTLTEAAQALAGAKMPLPTGDAPFIDLYAAVIDPPTIGRNILGQQQYTRAVGALGPGETALFVASRGLYSYRGTAWRRDGVFDRLVVTQGDARIALVKSGYTRIDDLAITGAPELKERSIFHLPGDGFDPTRPFTLELTASRAAETGEVSFTTDLGYVLPAAHITEPPAAPAPLWQSRWQEKRLPVASVMVMMAALTMILLAQEWIVRRKRLWLGLRLGYLTLTLVWLGWVLNGQLSVVQVVAFVQSLLSGFHWETFLIEPVIFTLWAGVALGLLFWGRGVFCGWLCPFGALQELSNLAARRLGVPQIAVPHAIHERLWIIKYTLFVAILALSFYSMDMALRLAEAEPFKTAISMRMMRAWPFVAFVVVLLLAGLFIERFYCRYLCPLGAALAIPAKLKIFDWLHRRPQCGRECRLCETKCTVGAIDPLGRINPNECVLCLRCQVVMTDPGTCPVLKRRQRQPEAKPS